MMDGPGMAMFKKSKKKKLPADQTVWALFFWELETNMWQPQTEYAYQAYNTHREAALLRAELYAAHQRIGDLEMRSA